MKSRTYTMIASGALATSALAFGACSSRSLRRSSTRCEPPRARDRSLALRANPSKASLQGMSGLAVTVSAAFVFAKGACRRLASC